MQRLANLAGQKVGNKMILWEGESQFSGEPIVVIATGLARKSQNEKTGDMVQVWILSQDTHPGELVTQGNDFTICGDCKLRAGEGCYLNVWQAPSAVWKAYKAGKYPTWDRLTPFTKPVRLGAYGDMGALPRWFTDGILELCHAGYTGYTHAWKHRPDLAKSCMASVHNRAEMDVATAKGWRTFRTGTELETLADNEIQCPSEKIQCSKCKMCDGVNKHVRNIFIPAHGNGAKKVWSL